MAEGVRKRVNPTVIGCSKQSLKNKFLDHSSPSMRKGNDGEK